MLLLKLKGRLLMANNVICGKCGGTYSARGFYMHEAFCKGEKQESKKKIDAEGSIKKCHACGSDDIKRVDEFSTIQPAAVKKILEAGYTHVCNKCAEVLK